jgi:hypothetical protein
MGTNASEEHRARIFRITDHILDMTIYLKGMTRPYQFSAFIPDAQSDASTDLLEFFEVRKKKANRSLHRHTQNILVTSGI